MQKATVPLLENEMCSVTKDSQNLGKSKFTGKTSCTKLGKELLKLRLKYEADVSAVKERCKSVSGTGLEAGSKDATTSFSQFKTIFKCDLV